MAPVCPATVMIPRVTSSLDMSARRASSGHGRERSGRGGKRRAGALAVVRHPGGQLRDAGEFHLLTDPGDERDVESAAIEVAGEIEQEHFEEWRRGREHRPAAE